MPAEHIPYSTAMRKPLDLLKRDGSMLQTETKNTLLVARQLN